MIYEINGEYYIRISPLRYKKIKMELIDDDVKIVALSDMLEANGKMVINQINFQQEKQKFREQLINEITNETNAEDSSGSTETRRYRRRG